MITDSVGQQLHDQATRGVVLTAEAQAQLEEWYAQQDRRESVALAGLAPPQTLADLQVQVDAAVGQLATVSQRIQVLAGENEAVRKEVAALQRQLAQRTTAQPT